MWRFKISLTATLLMLLSSTTAIHGQTQKGPLPRGNPEAGEEPAGGYQAPPGSGRMAGPTRQLAVEGLEVEFPTFKLKLPRLTLPCFTSYHTPPRMLLDEAVAPYVRQYREEFSLEAGPQRSAPESAPEEDRRPRKPPTQRTLDAPEDDALAARLRGFEEREQSLSDRLEGLEQTLEQLVNLLEAKQDGVIRSAHRSPELQPLPMVQEPQYPVRRTSFLAPIPLRWERLPPVR